VEAEVVGENPFFIQGTTVRGHEFHHSRLDILGCVRFAYKLRRGHGICDGEDGITYRNLFASYTHIHALGTQEWAVALVSLSSGTAKGNLEASCQKDEQFLSLNSH
jgi:cobyrinic acid a,c-diamide synthase